jgi:hypothetical protein
MSGLSALATGLWLALPFLATDRLSDFLIDCVTFFKQFSDVVRVHGFSWLKEKPP